MYIRYKLILNFCLILIIIINCKKESAPTQIQEQPTIIEKSPKRGLAYNITEPADFDTLKSGVSWWYNWYFKSF
jgi:hypothetical protein